MSDNENFQILTPDDSRSLPQDHEHYQSPRLMIVLINDKGIAASEKVLEGYPSPSRMISDGLCLVHRLFLALVKEYPRLKIHTARRIIQSISAASNGN